MKNYVLIYVFLMCPLFLTAQTIENEAILTEQWTEKAIALRDSAQYDSAAVWFAKVAALHKNTQQWRWYLYRKSDEVSCYKLNLQLDTAILIAEKAIAETTPYINSTDTVMAYAHYQRALAHYQNSDYLPAKQHLFTAIASRRAATGRKDYQFSEYYNSLGKVCYFQTQLDSALHYFHKALNVRKETLGENHSSTINMYNNIAIVYDQNTQYQLAEEFYTKALKARQRLLQPNHPDIATSLMNLAQLYSTIGEYDKGLEYSYQALEILEKNYSGMHIEKAKCYHTIGLIFRYQDLYEEALEYYHKALHSFEAIAGKNNQYYFRTKQSIASIYDEIGEYNLSLRYKKELLEQCKQLFGEYHALTGKAYTNLGVTCSLKGEYALSLENAFKGLEIHRKLFGENSRYTANSYANIGSLYIAMNQHNMAIEYFQKELNIHHNTLENETRDVAYSCLNLGQAHNHLGEYEKASEYLDRALRIMLDNFDEPHHYTSTIYRDIGQNHWQQQQYDSALVAYNKALAIDTALYGQQHSIIATNYQAIGNVLLLKGDWEEAQNYLQKSTHLSEQLLGGKHPDVAAAYNNLADLYMAMQQPGKALQSYQKAICSNMYTFDDSTHLETLPDDLTNYMRWDELMKAMKNKARIFADTQYHVPDFSEQQRFEIALQHYQAIDQLIHHLRPAFTKQNDKIELGKKATEAYNAAVELCLKMQEFDNEAIEQAFYFSQQSKMAVFMETLAAADARRFAQIPDSLLQKERQLNIDIAMYKKQLLENPDNERRMLLNDRLFHLNRSRDSLILVFEQQSPEYYHLKYSKTTASVADLQQLLDKKTALINYMVSDSLIHIFTITTNDVQVKTTPKPHNFDVKTTLLYNSFSTIDENNEYYNVYTNLAHEFYTGIFPQNIDKKIDNLVIIPDAQLNRLPFELLLTTPVASGTSYDEMPYLLHDYIISYTYSADLFYRLFSSPATEQNPHNWLAIAPVFATPETATLATNTRQILSAMADNDTTTSQRSLLLDNGQLPPLYESEMEVRTIYKKFRDKNREAEIRLFQNANEEFAQSGQLSNYRYLHFATHGFVDKDNPEFSGIFLAQDSSSTHDGILHTAEIYNLNLNAELTVLSACETGLGKIEQGEGIVGLSRALLYAGSRNLIVSLWKVPDTSTAELMIAFYDALLKTRHPHQFAALLREAKLQLIENKTYSKPVYWSPFILIGQ